MKLLVFSMALLSLQSFGEGVKIYTREELFAPIISPILIVLMLFAIWPLFATQIRRWHDRGKSGWWCFINVIPVIGGLWSFVELGLLPSVGADPFGNKNDYRE